MSEWLVQRGWAAEAFGIIWEQTLDEVRLNDTCQGELYRELIGWFQAQELFTGLKDAPVLEAWRDGGCDF